MTIKVEPNIDTFESLLRPGEKSQLFPFTNVSGQPAPAAVSNDAVSSFSVANGDFLKRLESGGVAKHAEILPPSKKI